MVFTIIKLSTKATFNIAAINTEINAEIHQVTSSRLQIAPIKRNGTNHARSVKPITIRVVTNALFNKCFAFWKYTATQSHLA